MCGFSMRKYQRLGRFKCKSVNQTHNDLSWKDSFDGSFFWVKFNVVVLWTGEPSLNTQS